jgi:hypothetical protein
VHQPTFDVNLGTAYPKVTSRIMFLVDIVPFKGLACNTSRRGDSGVIAEALRTRVEMTVRSRASRIPNVLGRQSRTFVCLLESLGNVGFDVRTTFVRVLRSFGNVGVDGRTTFVRVLQSFGNVGVDGRTTFVVRVLQSLGNVGVDGRTTFIRVLQSFGNVGVDGRSVDDTEDQRRDEDDVKGVDDIQSQRAAVEQPLSKHLNGIKVCLKPLPKVCN